MNSTQEQTSEFEMSKNQEEYDRDMRTRIYSCAFCKFVQQTMGVDNLEAIDLKKYLYHMKRSHGLEP